MPAVRVLALLCGACVVSAIHRTDLFPYGTQSGDLILAEGDDETSRVLTLPRPLYFFDTLFYKLYVATNGIISAHDLPLEKQYVDDGLPTDFPVVAPFLADIDTSGGQGQIYYRVTETPSVLNRVAREVHRGFPDAKFAPTHAVVATWEDVAAYEGQSRVAGPSNKVNTFQAVIGYDETDSYVLFLYPEGGLNFYGTSPKESYNVQIELPARVGFSRGEVSYLFFSRTEGPYYSVTSNEQSVKNLCQVGNTGVPGVWLFHTGNRYSFGNIVPASVSGLVTPSPREHSLSPDTTTPEYADPEEYPENIFDPEPGEEDDYSAPSTNPDFQPAPGGRDPPSPSEEDSGRPVLYGNIDGLLTSESRYRSEPEENHYAVPNLPPTVLERGAQQQQEPQRPQEVVDLYPIHGNEPPLSPGRHVVTVDEDDVDFDTGVIQYTTENKETCARSQHQCSQHAFCTDYATGFCCHCGPGFYGNGRHCLPEGAPQRVSGKFSGTVSVGSTPVELNEIHLHSYIVVGDGRAYTAISKVPESVGWALMPLAPIGELFGWLFALELPNSQAGFKIAGAEFVRRAEVQFYPGNQRLSITQTGRGLDEHNHLNVDTVVSGNVPPLPPGAEVTMEPFKETYQYYPSVTTSISVREFSVVSKERGTESYSFHLKQNITYRDCRHDNRGAKPETLQIIMERVFAMYITEERMLTYALTNKISPLGVEPSEPEEVNPCYTGNHDCDTTAKCIPLEGQAFRCQCATGYEGDGHNCYDVDECAEGRSTCGDHSQCVNLPGSHRCLCQRGFEFAYDGRTCVDIDECTSSPCNINARCLNEQGSFQCQCQPGFYGDGFYCTQQDEHTIRPKSQCERHRDILQSGEVQGRPNLGAFIPQCDSSGHYRPLQCHGSTGHCWCVDSDGQERVGTRTPPGTPPKDCDIADEPERPRTQCEHHRDSIQTSTDTLSLGAYVPQCDSEGKYMPLQCHGSSGHCWCVDSRGQERPGTRTSPGALPKDCDNPDEPQRPKTNCEHHRDSVQASGQSLGAYEPQCDENGQYLQRQCHSSSGYCWCVDSSGQEKLGTRTAAGTPSVDCERAYEPQPPKTHCEHHRDSAQASGASPGAYVPQCDENGQYLQRQCHGSTGHCWCVDTSGQERPGTRTAPGTPSIDCYREDEPQCPKTHCEHHRDSVRASGASPGAYEPQCDENGQYLQRQCQGSSGYCWCVDSSGQERPGTRTAPDTQSVDCDRADEPQRPKTHCEHHRDGVRASGPSPRPYEPQCDENGQYLQRQCHGSTGHCWCVDSSGQERPGTRSAPGTPRRDCDKPDEPVAAKTLCEHHRERAQATSSEGYPGAGAYVPQCDADGQYIPQQCHGSTGHCWCVDENGQERAETRTPPGTQPKDCNQSDQGTRPESVCERWRASLMEHYGGSPDPQQYLPQCESDGHFRPVQCYGETTYCWCVDQDGREISGTRSYDAVKPACLPTMAPPIVRPLPRPDVTPPTNTDVTLLYAQGQKIGALPINGTRLDETRSKTLLTLHGSIVVGIAHDCKENKVYWTDLSERTINRASMASGAEPEVLINRNLVSPEGLALDVNRRLMFWVDSMPDVIESANLDGSGRRTLFDRDLVNPRAIIVVSSTGTLYWTDWNREAPKIECSSVDGQNRRVVVSDGVGLPNALTYDSSTQQICWADAGTKRLECISPDGSGRRVIHSSLNYPFSMVYYRDHFYYTDWRRDGVIALSKTSSKFTDEYLPDQRSHLYGIAIATAHCLPGSH
ncbi:nidogen-2 isoform 2-T2 [Menidia menidia]